MQIRYVAPAFCPEGYGEFSRCIIAALHEAGHELSVSNLLDGEEPAAQYGEKGALAKRLLERKLSSSPDVNIINSTPVYFDRFRLDGVPNIGFTMYEAEWVHREDVDLCNAMDAIFVPSKLNRQVLLDHGVSAPVFVVQPAISPRKRELPPANSPFTFYSVFEWITPHKDPNALLTAYFTEFKKSDPVLLRIKTFERRRPGSIEIDIRALKDSLGLRSIPPVEVVAGQISNAELWSYYDQADAYVSSHHGEGWGMPIWEAMSLGIPAIATGYGASLEFMKPENSFLVTHDFDKSRLWANVDTKDLARVMRHVFEHRDEASAVGSRGRNDVLSTFTAERTSSQVTQALENLSRFANCESRITPGSYSGKYGGL